LTELSKKKPQKGYRWTFLTGDGKMIYYNYQPGRGGERPLNILKDFKGHLQTDGYAVYDELPLENITVFYCMAHARRKIYDGQSNNEKLASYALQEITKLYAIEQACQEEQLNEEQIKNCRNKENFLILKALGDWMKNEDQQLRPKSPIAQAFAYSIKRW